MWTAVAGRNMDVILRGWHDNARRQMQRGREDCVPAPKFVSKRSADGELSSGAFGLSQIPVQGGPPGRPDIHWTRPVLPNSSGGAVGGY
jgi:hypothetical protein